jgi:nucleoside-diphosphate-sugar epimerase
LATTQEKRLPIIGCDDPILVTGASGFIGTRVVDALLKRGFVNIRCFVRSAASGEALKRMAVRFPEARLAVMEGNLLSHRDCADAARDVRLVYHLAAGMEKSFAGCILNSVVTTRNLLESVGQAGTLRRFVNVSSFAVYSNATLRRQSLLDETCPLETDHVWRNEPYAYAKLKQEEIVAEHAAKWGFPCVILRPGAVYGPGMRQLTGRVGLGTFGIFLHLGGPNRIPFTYVDNCADAIVLAGIVQGVDGEIFNVVDDELPSSREFMRGYKKNVGSLRYIPVPYRLFYLFCWLWESHSRWSQEQLPPVFNRRKCETYWKGNRYSNRKLKELLGWSPKVSYEEGSRAYFSYLKELRSC